MGNNVMKNNEKVITQSSNVDLDLDKVRLESIKPSSELSQFSEYVRKEQSTLRDLTKAFGVPNPLKETQEAIQKIFNERQYTLPEFPKLETTDITDLIIKESQKHPLPAFEDRDKHWKEEILNKFDKLIQDKDAKEIKHKCVVTYTTKDANLTIDGKSIHIKGRNQRDLCSQLFKETSKEEYIVTMEKLIKNLGQQDVFNMSSKKRNKLADKYIRDAISLNNTLKLKHNIDNFLTATREYIKVKD